MTSSLRYPDDLLDQEWNLIDRLVDLKNSSGERKPLYPRREMLNAIFYLLRTGCGWRHLPHDLPPWKTVSPMEVEWITGEASRPSEKRIKSFIKTRQRAHIRYCR